MKIELDNISSHLHRIHSYEEGFIKIGQSKFDASLIVTPSVLIHTWAPQSVNDIASHHLDQILELKPEMILLGTGKQQHFPDRELFIKAAEHQIGLEVMDTGAACRSYNILLEEGRNIAAALLMIE